jgi:hypothetical protein
VGRKNAKILRRPLMNSGAGARGAAARCGLRTRWQTMRWCCQGAGGWADVASGGEVALALDWRQLTCGLGPADQAELGSTVSRNGVLVNLESRRGWICWRLTDIGCWVCRLRWPCGSIPIRVRGRHAHGRQLVPKAVPGVSDRCAALLRAIGSNRSWRSRAFTSTANAQGEYWRKPLGGR